MARFRTIPHNRPLGDAPGIGGPEYDDAPEGECPTCGGVTDNWEPHGCDEDCRRGCRASVPGPCDDCASACECCGSAGEKHATHTAFCIDCATKCECGAPLDISAAPASLCAVCASKEVEP